MHLFASNFNNVRVYSQGSGYGTTSHDVVQIKHLVCHSSITNHDSIYICCSYGLWFGSHLGDLGFGNSACTFQFIMGPVFLYFFEKFLNFKFRG